jgi:hypothetical protein
MNEKSMGNIEHRIQFLAVLNSFQSRKMMAFMVVLFLCANRGCGYAVYLSPVCACRRRKERGRIPEGYASFHMGVFLDTIDGAIDIDRMAESEQ